MIISVDAAAGGTPTASNSLGTRMGEGGGEEAQNMEVLQGMGFSKAWVSFLDSYPCDSPRHSHNFPFPPQHSLPFSAFALRKKAIRVHSPCDDARCDLHQPIVLGIAA
jgi:hypothetical protein